MCIVCVNGSVKTYSKKCCDILFNKHTIKMYYILLRLTNFAWNIFGVKYN